MQTSSAMRILKFNNRQKLTKTDWWKKLLFSFCNEIFIGTIALSTSRVCMQMHCSYLKCIFSADIQNQQFPVIHFHFAIRTSRRNL